MGWLHTFIVFQCTILLLHGRPDGTGTKPETSTTLVLSPSSSTAPLLKVNEEVSVGMEHPGSVLAAIVASLEPKTAPAMISENRKHLAANIPIRPVQTFKRVMTPITPIIKTEKSNELVTSGSTVAPTIKTTRYYKISSVQCVNSNNKDHNQLHVQESNKNNNNNNNSMLKDENVDKSRDLHDNKANRRFVENFYTLNTFVSTTASPPSLYQTNQWPYAQILVSSLTTERPLQSFLAPATQTETILVNSDYLYDPSNVINPDENYLNFDKNLENFQAFQYQIPRPLPHINLNPIVNIPYRRRPEYSTASPTLLHLSKNITRLYSLIGSSTTPDPYNQYQKLHIKPPVTEQKVIKLSVTTKRPNKQTHNSHNNNNNKHHSEYCQGNCDGGNSSVKKTNKNGSYNSNNDENNNDDYNSWDNGNQYNESSQIISNFNDSTNLYSANQSNGNPNNVNTNFHTINQPLQNNTKSKECLIKLNSPNVPGENVCDTNDLRIIIKFDNPIALNNTTEKPKQRKKRPSNPKTTTTTAPTSPLPFFYSANSENDYYESAEIEEESSEFGGFLGPFQNIFGFGSDDGAQEKRPNRRKKPSHGNGGHNGHNKPMAVPDINKYQTIILQSPAPPTIAPPSSKHNIKKITFLKFLAFLPILTVLKPALFGLWTLVLSPILVIAIGGIALGVVLYPFLTISREQTISYSSPYRSARVVIHKHRRPKKRRPQHHIVIPAVKRSRPPFVRQRTFTIEPHLRYRIVQSTPTRRRVSFSHRRWQPRPPIRIRTFHHHRSKRRAQDASFQQWLLIQNNFNVRVMSHHDDDNDYN